MAANKMDEILKHFPDLEDGWKEMQEMIEKKIIEPAEMDVLCLKYRERLEREKLKENLPEPEFTKTKKADETSKVTSKVTSNVSNDLEEAAQEYTEKGSKCQEELDAFKTGANWQKEQLMAKAVDATVHIDAGGYPYIPQMELYDYDKDIPLAKEGEKVKVIVIKED